MIEVLFFMMVNVHDVITFHGLKPQDLRLQKDDTGKLDEIVETYISHAESLIKSYTNNKFNKGDVPGAVQNVCIRLVSNMIQLTIQRRDSPIIKVNDWQIRTVSSADIPKSVQKKALSVVGNSKGVAAAKKIAKFCAGLKYLPYSNHKHPPEWVILHGGNCCDKTRLMLVMMDAAGCLETLGLYYVHCHGNGKGHVYARIVHNGKKVDVDPCCQNPWGNHLVGYGPVVGTKPYNGPATIAY